jgi:hypothetical protein
VPLSYTVVEAFTDLGRWDESLAEADRMIARAAEQGASYWRVLPTCIRLHILAVRGHHDDVRQGVEQLLAEAREIGDATVVLSALDAAAVAALEREDLGAALDLAHEAVVELADQAPRVWGAVLPTIGRVALSAGDRSLLDAFDRRSDVVFPRDRVVVGTADAMTHELEGRLAEARTGYLDAAEGWRLFSVEEHARALLAAARCGERLGAADAAHDREQGMETMAKLGGSTTPRARG